MENLKINLLDISCPSCNHKPLVSFYSIKSVPVNSVLLFHKKEEAINYPKGDINLAYCSKCGMITNTSFDQNLIEYSNRYEETQGFSDIFKGFHKELALYLIEKYDLRGKNIVEIGCGKGEFIALLCELGSNNGIGIDPAFIPERKPEIIKGSVEYYSDWYSKKYAHLDADIYICKMTLEHIQNTYEFISMIRETIGNRTKAIVFFQVPDVSRILEEMAFWDIYYEHCSYFCPDSLGKLFSKAGFEVLNIYTGFDNQYLMIEATPKADKNHVIQSNFENDISNLFSSINAFSKNVNIKINTWSARINEFYSDKKRVVIWGGSSKTVSFITTLGITKEIEYVVDINPYKQNTFLPGNGQQVVLPEFLVTYRPDVVILMNPIYLTEVSKNLANLGLDPHLISIDA